MFSKNLQSAMPAGYGHIRYAAETMSLDVPLALYATCVVPGLFWMGAYKFLPGGNQARPTLLALSGVAASGVVGYWFLSASLALMIVLVSPVYQFAVFWAARRIFLGVADREPVDVAVNFESGLAADRIYAMGSLAAAFFPVFAVLSLFFFDGKFSAA
jgi:hypothetical protein